MYTLSWAMHASDYDPARMNTLRVTHQLSKLNANMLKLSCSHIETT